MNGGIIRKSFFIAFFFLLFISWMIFTQNNRPLADIGINLFTITSYVVTLVWMSQSIKKIQDKQQYFWLFFAIGTCFLFISKLISLYLQMQAGGMFHPSILENILRLVGYLFFFIGFIYRMKVIKNTLPMLRFLLNIIIVIITVYSVSWHFILNPILVGNQDITQIRIFISSIYHVLNISLLFAAICVIFISQSNQSKMSLYLIAVGFLIQVIGDFFHINQVKFGGNWIFILWPMSVFLMGLSASLSSVYQQNPINKVTEQLKYKNFHLSFISVGILLSLTFYNQLHDTNILQEGLQLTVIILLLQQVITAVENKSIFKKLIRLASSEGNFGSGHENTSKQDNEISKLLRKIEKVAHYDSLTDLPNRTLFHKCMEQVLKAAEQSGTPFSLFYIDMDRFKYVNDSLGHDCGDLLLQQVALRLRSAVCDSATVARIGGDEFAIILPESNKLDLRTVANYILEKFEKPFTVNGQELYTTPSIGISIYPQGGTNEKELLKSADAAMYLAKEEGKNKFKFFDPALNEQLSKKMFIETRLRKGLEDQGFSLNYQPQVDLRTEKIVGLEALLRWNDPELGKVSPQEFIPIAEETGLIEPIGRWVIKTACQQLRKWQQMGLPDVSMAVNVSIRQFQNPNFVKEVKAILNETKLAPHYLKIEITESILQNIDKTAAVLNNLRELGIQIAIDDFGTGYSSLSYLKNLPVSCLKIDKAFIDELSDNPEGPIVKTIIDMGRNMNFTVIAEGVESKEHVAFLRENKCFVGQGYLFSKPLPEAEIEQFLLGIK